MDEIDLQIKKTLKDAQFQQLSPLYKGNDIGGEANHSLERGYRALISEIEKDAINNVYKWDNIDSIAVDSCRVEDKMIAFAQHVYQTKQKIPLSLLFDYSNPILLTFYHLAVEFYHQADYQKSIDAFIFLTALYPSVQPFWVGLALGYEKKLQFTEAIESLETAIRADLTNFSPFYGLIRCSESIKNFDKAIELLNEQKEKQEAKELLNYIKNHY